MKVSNFFEFEQYLKKSNEDYIELTFDQIEEILGIKLCDTAYNNAAYWYRSPTHTFTLAWLNAGYKMEKLDIRARKVSFIRITESIGREERESNSITPSYVCDSWEALDNDIAIKTVDKSVFKYNGSGVPIEVRPYFLQNMKSTKTNDILLTYHDIDYKARITFTERANNGFQTRLFWATEFTQLLEQKFKDAASLLKRVSVIY